MNLADALRQLADNPAAPLDLAEVALLIAGDEYSGLDVADYLSQIDALADQLRPRLRGNLDEQTQRLADFLFDDQGFAGNADQYYDPRNSYLNEVLDRRLGIPITLSVLAMAVGRRAGLAVAGVGLPGHFIAKVIGEEGEVLFDPFHGGQLVSPADCERLVRSVTGQPFRAVPAALAATPAGVIVMRMLNNLKQIYVEAGDFDRGVRVIERQLQLDPADVSLRRDLGVSLVQAGRLGPSLGHLAAYLDAAPAAEDSDEVRQLLRRARAELARWN